MEIFVVEVKELKAMSHYYRFALVYFCQNWHLLAINFLPISTSCASFLFLPLRLSFALSEKEW